MATTHADPPPPQEEDTTHPAAQSNPEAAAAAAAAPPPPPPTNDEPEKMDEDTPAPAVEATAQQQQQQQQEEEQQQQQQDQQQPDSPPLPTRHTAVAPGPRAARLQELYASSLARTLGRVSWDNFAACYPTAAAAAPQALRRVQRQMVERLGELCNREFEAIMTNRNVVPKLNELEALISDASRRRDEKGDAEPPIPPHLLPADDVLAAHMAPHLASQQSQLNAKLQTVQAHNARLFGDVQAQRAELESLLEGLEAALRDVDGASELLDGVVEDLAQETRDVELEMASSAGRA